MFEPGDRVYIHDGNEYHGRFINYTGEVVRVSRPSYRPGVVKVGVRIDGCTNTASGYGAYWFDQYHIQYEEEYNMTDNTLTGFKRAKIRFLGNQYSKGKTFEGPTYVYSTTMDDLQPGDTLVVHTASHGLAVAEFIEYTGERRENVAREVMARVDLTEYNERKKRAKRVLELKRQMDKALKEAQDLALYEAVAKNNPALAEMLAEYKALTLESGETDNK